MRRWQLDTRIDFKTFRCCSPSMPLSAAGARRRLLTSRIMVPSTGSTASNRAHVDDRASGNQRTRASARASGLWTDIGIYHGVSLVDRIDSTVRGIHSQLRIGMESFLGSGDGAA